MQISEILYDLTGNGKQKITCVVIVQGKTEIDLVIWRTHLGKPCIHIKHFIRINLIYILNLYVCTSCY